MDEIKTNLVINKLQSKAIYNYLAENNRIGLNELYLVENDDAESVTSVNYDSDNRKLTYTNENNEVVDIISIQALKNVMSLSTVSSDGSYNSLSNKPSINNVTLEGNKSAAQLGISYNDLSNQPTIPQTTTAYTSSDETKAMTGKATAAALTNYVPKTTTVTGTGALQGGGALNGNQTISHKTAPTGLQTGAYKVGVDTYGHVQLGGAITASDINAEPTSFSVQNDVSHLDGRYGTIFCICSGSGTFHMDYHHEDGVTLNFYHVNETSSPIDITFDIDQMHQQHDYIYYDGSLMEQSWTASVPPKSYNYITLKCFNLEGLKYAFIDRNSTFDVKTIYSNANGVSAVNKDMTGLTSSDFQIQNVNLFGAKYIRCVIKGGGDTNDRQTPPIVVEVDLSVPDAFGNYVGVAGGLQENDQNTTINCIVAVNSSKNAICFVGCKSLYGTVVGDRNNNGRNLVKVEAFYY